MQPSTADDARWLGRADKLHECVDASSCCSSGVSSPLTPARRSGFAVGAKAVAGGRPTMEDAYAVHADAIRARSRYSSTAGTMLQGGAAEDVFSYFAVFDGHGGSETANHCASRLHVNLQESLAPRSAPGEGHGESDGSASPTGSLCSEDRVPDSSAAGLCSCSGAPGAPSCRSCQGTLRLCTALKQAFQRTDAELAGTEIGEVVGSTAVVALVGASHIYVAHCGELPAWPQAAASQDGPARALRPHRPGPPGPPRSGPTPPVPEQPPAAASGCQRTCCAPLQGPARPLDERPAARRGGSGPAAFAQPLPAPRPA
jgi:hypothetical protein